MANQRKRRLRLESLEGRQMMAADGWTSGEGLSGGAAAISLRHNLLHATDVDIDGTTTPLDALIIVNEINSNRSDLGAMRMSDTNNDGSVSPLDVLVVVNTLNSDRESSVWFQSNPGFNQLGLDGASDSQSEGLLAVEDTVNVTLPTDATSVRPVTIDALMNDIGNGLRIVEVGNSPFASITVVEDPDNPGRDVVRYVPLPGAAKYDRFSYTIEDRDGFQSTSFISMNYEQSADGFQVFRVDTPEQVTVDAGEVARFRDADGRPTIQVNYMGDQPAKVGILLSWAPPSGYYAGDRFAGRLTSTAEPPDASVYAQPTGAVWIYGSIAGVNRILANLEYTPATGFSAEEGLSLNLFAFLYSDLNISVRTLLERIEVVVSRDVLAPRAVDDFFAFASVERPVEVDILANDRTSNGGSSSGLRLISITPPSHSDAEIIWDASKRKVTYRGRSTSILGLDQFAYTIEDEFGRRSQAIATLGWN